MAEGGAIFSSMIILSIGFGLKRLGLGFRLVMAMVGARYEN